MKGLISGIVGVAKSTVGAVANYGYSFADQSIADSVTIDGNNAIIVPSGMLDASAPALWNYQIDTLLNTINSGISSVKVLQGVFDNDQATKFLRGLLAKPSLTSITASFEFSDEVITRVANDLKSNTTLQLLDLSNNESLSAASAETLKDIVRTNNTLLDVKASAVVKNIPLPDAKSIPAQVATPTWSFVEGYANANRGNILRAVFLATSLTGDVSGVVYEYITFAILPAHTRYISTLDQVRIGEIADADTKSAAQATAIMVVQQLPSIQDSKEKGHLAVNALKNMASAPKSDAYVMHAPELYAAVVAGNKDCGKAVTNTPPGGAVAL